MNRNDLNNYKIFISKHWKKNHIFAKESKFFLWQHSNKKKINSICAFANNKIIGNQNYINFNQFDNDLSKGQIFLAIWTAPTNNQYISLGYLIYKKIIEIEQPIFIGTIGFSNTTIKFHKWQKFKIGEMNHSVFLTPYKKKYKIAEIDKDVEIKKIKKNSKIIFYKITKDNILNLNINNLFSYQIPIKSKKYLLKRYLQHPVFKYELFYHKVNKKITSLFVIREIKSMNSRIYKVIDFIGHNNDFFRIKYLLNDLFEKNKFEYASLYSYGIPKTILKKGNFIEVKNYSKLIIPNHFSPYEKKNITINYGYKSKKSKNVRMFNSDCDQDSPN